MLLFTLYLVLFYEIEPLHMKSVRCLFIYCQSLPNLVHHQIVFSIAVCSPVLSDIK
jgi:hypothetical protein